MTIKFNIFCVKYLESFYIGMVPTYESSEKFHCENCNYSTSRKSQYDRHLQTNKHKNLQNPTLKSSEPKWRCPCGKKYKHSSTL